MKNDFYITEITDELMNIMRGKSFKHDCLLPAEDLRYCHILHKNSKGEILEGEMVCNKHIAEKVVNIFKILFEAEYPIERVRLIDEYDADDTVSMTDNNCSSFNYRMISYSNKISKHGLGMAVDINPLYNPYIKDVDGVTIIDPPAGEPYVDRSKDFPFKITEEDFCYKVFMDHGFEWGGAWDNRKDYQHFEIPTDTIRSLYPHLPI